MEILRGRGLQIHVEVSFSGFEMWSNESHCTFPINSGNQTNTNTPSVEINKGSFFVIYFLFLFPALNDTDALLSIMFVTRQVEQNAKEEVQQCKNSKVNLWMIFYTLKIVLYNCLDAARLLFPALFMQSNEIHTQYISCDTCTKLFPVWTCCN